METAHRHRRRLIWVAVVPLFAWAAIRTFGVEGDTPLAALIAFTPYAALVGLALVGLGVALRDRVAAGVAGVAAIALVCVVLPRAVGKGEEVPPDATELTIISANLHLGRADLGALTSLVDQVEPDVVRLQELNGRYAKELRQTSLDRRLPEHILSVGRGNGVGIYARFPLRRLSQPFQVKKRILAGELEMPDGRRIKLVDVHPLTPAGAQADRWSNELNGLPITGDSLPWVLVGDFNATLDHAVLRNVIDRGYRDAGAATGNGLVATWPNDRPYPPLITIDHILADSRIGIANYGVADLPGSDHRAIWGNLFLRP